MEGLFIAVLSSSVVAAIVSALVSGGFALRAKRVEYENEYFKKVIERRLEAYEAVEHLILLFKNSVIGDDEARPYHLIFNREDWLKEYYKHSAFVSASSLWLSDDMFDATQELNRVMFSLPGDASLAQAFGKDNYVRFAEIRSKMERTMMADLSILHDVPSFLKRKPYGSAYTDAMELVNARRTAASGPEEGSS